MNGSTQPMLHFYNAYVYIRCLGFAVGFVSFLFLTCNSYFYVCQFINPTWYDGIYTHSENYVGGVLFHPIRVSVF